MRRHYHHVDSDTLRQLTKLLASIDEELQPAEKGHGIRYITRARDLIKQTQSLIPDYDRLPDESEFETAAKVATDLVFRQVYADWRLQRDHLYIEGMTTQHGKDIKQWPMPAAPDRAYLDVVRYFAHCERAWGEILKEPNWAGWHRVSVTALAGMLNLQLSDVIYQTCMMILDRQKGWDLPGQVIMPKGIETLPIPREDFAATWPEAVDRHIP